MSDRVARRIVAVEAAILLLLIIVALAIGDHVLSAVIGIVVAIALAALLTTRSTDE